MTVFRAPPVQKYLFWKNPRYARPLSGEQGSSLYFWGLWPKQRDISLLRSNLGRCIFPSEKYRVSEFRGVRTPCTPTLCPPMKIIEIKRNIEAILPFSKKIYQCLFGDFTTYFLYFSNKLSFDFRKLNQWRGRIFLGLKRPNLTFSQRKSKNGPRSARVFSK